MAVGSSPTYPSTSILWYDGSMKRCPRCERDKPLEDFARKGAGYQSYCRPCNKEHKNGWIKGNRDKVRWNRLWTNYRMRQGDWDRMFSEQGGLCYLCRSSEPTCVDHDHNCCPNDRSCGQCVRKLLCQPCNIFVGQLETRQHLLKDALQYTGVSV